MLLDFKHLGPFRWVLCAIGVLVCGFLLLPMVFIVLLSFDSSPWLIFPPPTWTTQWYAAFFADPAWIDAVINSVKVGAVVSVVSVPLGLGVALALNRGSFRGKALLRIVVLMPMVLPVVVLAVGIYSLFLRLGLNDTFVGFVIAHVVIALPFSVIILGNGLLGFDRGIEDAAIVCGASPFRAKLTVTLPAIRVSLFSAAIFSFLASWDEIVISMFVAGPSLQTLPVQLWSTLSQDLTPIIAAASSLVLCVTLTLLLTAGFLAREGR